MGFEEDDGWQARLGLALETVVRVLFKRQHDFGRAVFGRAPGKAP
jgi:hypothetical protein